MSLSRHEPDELGADFFLGAGAERFFLTGGDEERFLLTGGDERFFLTGGDERFFLTGADDERLLLVEAGLVVLLTLRRRELDEDEDFLDEPELLTLLRRRRVLVVDFCWV